MNDEFGTGARLHHVGVICTDREAALALIETLGLSLESEQYVDNYKADCLFTNGPGARLELIVPRGGKLAKFNKGAGGIHHIAMEVDDLGEASKRLRAKGVELLEREAVPAGPLSINFIPPAYTRGVIVELVESRMPKAPND